jgi:hypothetical protein
METPNDPFAFLKAAWPGFSTSSLSAGLPQSSLPTTDLEEIDRRIADLKTVEQWLSLNLNILKTTIQGLEIQKGTIAAVQSWQASMADFGKAATSATSAKSDTTTQPRQSAAPTQGETPQASAEQPQWWWASMQDQFSQLVQAAGAIQAAADKGREDSAQASDQQEPKSKRSKSPRSSQKPGRARRAASDDDASR